MEIKNHPNYLIYPDGRVWSKRNNKFLKHNTFSRYNMVMLYDDKIKFKTVHRLVAEHYIPNPDGKSCVDHINRNKSDNRVENLRWVTSHENSQNIGKNKRNTTGHSNITYDSSRNKWRWIKNFKNKRHYKRFDTLTEALCFKYIQLLKIKAGSF